MATLICTSHDITRFYQVVQQLLFHHMWQKYSSKDVLLMSNEAHLVLLTEDS